MKNKKWIILIMFLTIIGVSVFLVFKNLTIKQMSFAGNKNLTEMEIRSGIGVKEGDSIIYPSSRTLYERLKKIPWIKDAIIRKDLSGTLTVYIKESTPVAIAIVNGSAYLIDYEAQVLEDFTEKVQNSQIFLPVIQIDPFKNKITLNEAIKLLNFINSKGYVKSQDEIVIKGNDPNSLTLYINGFPIIVGKGDFELKFAKYIVVNTEIQKRGLNVQYIDLRFPDRVIVKPAE
uniref:FtsQ-type POTRA domain-containing protein n=1 Tax=Thermodesulfovibrio aggregans TaxID=86166 RepID=A0A7C4AJ17_9BACT